MDKLINPGRIMFAVGFIALGFLCINLNDFIIGRPPAWPEGFEINPPLAYLSGGALILLSAAIILKKKAGLAAILIAVLIFLFSVLRVLPQFTTNWLNGSKSLALLGGALIVSRSFFIEHPYSQGLNLSERLRKNLLSLGCILIAIFFIAAAYSHFKFAAFVFDFIPAYIPFHAFWTYFCGICLGLGGVGILIPPTRKLAALLSGIMVLGWFLLLHIPRFLSDTTNVSDRLGLCESFTIAGIFFVLAGMHSDKKR